MTELWRRHRLEKDGPFPGFSLSEIADPLI
jgi:hypothetical protein